MAEQETQTLNGQPLAEAASGRLSNAERRKRAFQVNLRLALEQELDESVPPPTRAALIDALGAAFAASRHLVEARTQASVGLWPYYLVLMAGLVRPRGGKVTNLVSPFAELLLSRTHGVGVRFTEAQLAAIGRAIDRSEIVNKHPFDRRWTLSTRWLRAYVTFIGGPCRRHAQTHVDQDRRAPINPALGTLVFLALAFCMAAFGGVMIVATIWAMAKLLAEAENRSTFADLLAAMMKAIGS